MKLKHLIGREMLEQNSILHQRPEGFGGSGWKHADIILAYAHKLRAHTLLDYGCGERTLGRVLRAKGSRLAIEEFDPAIRALSMMPDPADLVVCTDVLEHVEPDRLDNVLQHLNELMLLGCYLVIATRPANKILPNGKNAHLIIESPAWWRERVLKFSWKLDNEEDRRKGNGDPHEYRIWLKR